MSKEVGDALKSSFEVAMQVTRWRGGVGGGSFMEKWGYHCVILLYRNFSVSLTGYCKRFYRIPLFPLLLPFQLFCFY